MSLNVVLEINKEDCLYNIYNDVNKFRNCYYGNINGECKKLDFNDIEKKYYYGMIDSEYKKLDYKGRTVYWKITFTNIYSGCLGYVRDISDEKFIEMRDSFEREVFGDIQFILPRLKSETIDTKYLGIIEQKIKKFGYGWLIDTMWYWNQKNKKYKRKSEFDVLRLQGTHNHNGYGGGIFDKYDNVYSHLNWSEVKGKSLYGLAIEEIADLSNFVPLLLNTIKKLVSKKKKESLWTLP